MPWSPGTHVVHLVLAVLIATCLASGWALLPATVALWILVMLASVLVDAVVRRLRRQPRAVAPGAHLDAAPTPPPTPAMLAPLRAPAVHAEAGAEIQHVTTREWRRHVCDVEPFDNERFPREGICTTKSLFLRAGDVLVLRFHPEGAATGRHLSWPCDLHHAQARAYQRVEVYAGRETRLPIASTGVYSLGIGQDAPGASTAPGCIGVWLCVPQADALSLSIDPVHGSACHYERGAAGGLVVRIEGEHEYRRHARLPTRSIRQVPRAAALLFASAQDHWDAAGIDRPQSHIDPQCESLYRWYLQLSRGDVLALEYAWQAAPFGQVLRFPRDNASTSTSGSLSVYRFVRGPQLHGCWSGAASARGIDAFTCDADGIYCLELALLGPPEWRTRPLADFIDLRLWGAFLQRPRALRDFDLREGSVEGWYWQLMPVPRGLVARASDA